MYPSKLIENAITEISTLPGIGRKTALRLVLYLLRKEKSKVHALSRSLDRLVEDIRYCSDCNSVSEGALCDLCNNPYRNQNGQICVVEEIHDLMAIESTGQYKGLYHVLGGVIAPLRGVQPEQLYIEHLIGRISARPAQFQEIIFALSATIEGDTTTLYVCRKLQNFDLQFTTLARGIPLGSELEYTDTLTLARSLSERHSYALPSESSSSMNHTKH